MDVFDLPICSGVSGTGMDVFKCEGFGQVLPIVIDE